MFEKFFKKNQKKKTGLAVRSFAAADFGRLTRFQYSGNTINADISSDMYT